MDYLVVIKNHPYFQWQAELLIESFKINNLQDQLVVCITDEKGSAVDTKNLARHKRIYRFDPYPSPYEAINQSYLTYAALKTGIVKQPFSLIHADTVLVRPMTAPERMRVSVNPYLLPEIKGIKGHPFYDFFRDVIREKSLEGPVPMLAAAPRSIGCVYQFNNVDLSFFEAVVRMTVEITKKWDRKYWPLANQVAWMINLVHANADIVEGVECPLVEHNFDKVHLIHYTKGLPPHFHKDMFRFDGSEFSFSGNNPLRTLCEQNISPATNYIINVIKVYLDEKRIPTTTR